MQKINAKCTTVGWKRELWRAETGDGAAMDGAGLIAFHDRFWCFSQTVLMVIGF